MNERRAQIQAESDHGLAFASSAVLAGLEHAGIDFCVEAPNEALQRFGAPPTFNTDQGSQFTSEPFTKLFDEPEVLE